MLGPNINLPMSAADNLPAIAAVERARSLAHRVNTKERALIEALAGRYSADPAAERASARRRLCRRDGARPRALPLGPRRRRAVRRGADEPVAVGLLGGGRHEAEGAHRRDGRDARARARGRPRPSRCRSTSTSTWSRPRRSPSAPCGTPSGSARRSRVPATWCTCRRTSTTASAATSTRSRPTSARSPPTSGSSPARPAAESTATVTTRTTSTSCSPRRRWRAMRRRRSRPPTSSPARSRTR